MSKFTLGQRQFPTLGLRSQQPKNYVGPTLSCYLGTYSVANMVNVQMLSFIKLNATVIVVASDIGA